VTIHDISAVISNDLPVYPGDPGIEIQAVSRISEGAGANVSLLKLGSHTGTHVDPPFHFLDDGPTVDHLPLDVMVGDCYVCSVEAPHAITARDLDSCGIPGGTPRVLFKTRNSQLWGEGGFRSDYVYLDPDAAGWLVDRGIRLVGVDYLSVERFRSGKHATHLRLLEAGVVVVEGLDLRAVMQGTYFLVCLPLRIREGDGGPARAILVEQG